MAGADEYKALYRKYVSLERTLAKSYRSNSASSKLNSKTLSDETGPNEEPLVSLFRNSYEFQQEDEEEKQQQKRT